MRNSEFCSETLRHTMHVYPRFHWGHTGPMTWFSFCGGWTDVGREAVADAEYRRLTGEDPRPHPLAQATR